MALARIGCTHSLTSYLLDTTLVICSLRGRGLGFRFLVFFAEVLVDGLVEQREGLFRFVRRGSDGGFDDEDGGSEPDGRRRFGVYEDFGEGLKGQIGESQGLLAQLKGADVQGVRQGHLEVQGIC